ncbi:MAG: biotin/lipoyl-binding protein [Acutalibacter sp.]|nr:biotin/lipoyl-binding protein [Acutalibacter sp.]
MPAGTTKKKNNHLVSIIMSIVAVVVLIIALWLYLQYRSDRRYVDVVPVSQVADSYWGDQASSSGIVVSDYIQELYPSFDKIISEVFVKEGDEVRIGDPLLQYDKTQLELEVELKEVAVKQADLNLTTAQNQLKKLQNTKPTTTPGPTAKPSNQPSSRPPSQGPAGTATPTPVPPSDVTAYSRLDLNSVPYAGSGTTEDPYVFLCTPDCVMTTEFLHWLLGTYQSDGSDGNNPDYDGDYDGDGNWDEPTPEPTARPGSHLVSPFAALFEVRDGNSNYGQLISAFKLDGTQLSANFQPEDAIPGYGSLDSIEHMFGASPSPSPNNYNHMGYTAAELKQLIADKKEEIQRLQTAKKQAQLDLRVADSKLKNSTVLSTVDGTVRTLIDLETATAENRPFLVVSGDSTYYVSGALSEGVLGVVQVGDPITVTDYWNGGTYTAEIVSIADYPLEEDSNLYYYGTGNPNSSSYEFTAVVDGGEGLQNGQYVDISLDLQNNSIANALYVQNAYIREDAAGSYVMIADRNNRLMKQYVQTGRSLYGYSMEIKSGLTIDDFIAFPYGTDVEEGVRVRLQGTEDEPPFGSDASLPTLDVSVPAGNAVDDIAEGEVMVE